METEAEIIRLTDWARGFLETEVEGRYTSDAALHLALAVWLNRPPMIRVVDQLRPDDVKPGSVQFRDRSIP